MKSEVRTITPALAESFKLGSIEGAIINGVLSGGPADKAGMKPGDVEMIVLAPRPGSRYLTPLVILAVSRIKILGLVAS